MSSQTPITNLITDSSTILPLTDNQNSSSTPVNLRQVDPSSSSRVDSQPRPPAHTTTPSLSQQPTSSLQTPTTINRSPNGYHPHLKDDIQDPIQSMLTRPESQAEQTDRALQTLKDRGIIDDKGKILGLWGKISGTIFKAEDGSFDFHIEGPCGNRSVKELQNLKDKIISSLTSGTEGNSGVMSKEEAEKLVRNIIPEAAGPLSPSDLQILNSGGCLQYRGTEEGYVKMALDPKEEGALTLTCFSRSNEEILEGASQTIPAPVVFEGKEADGYKVEPPTLPHWKQRLEAIRQEDQQKSQLAQNDVWNAVTRYLSGNRWGFNISNGQNNPEVSNGQNGANALGSHANNNNLHNDGGINGEIDAQNSQIPLSSNNATHTSEPSAEASSNSNNITQRSTTGREPPAQNSSVSQQTTGSNLSAGTTSNKNSAMSSVIADIQPKDNQSTQTEINDDANKRPSVSSQNQQNASATPTDNINSNSANPGDREVKSTDINKGTEGTASSQEDLKAKIEKINKILQDNGVDGKINLSPRNNGNKIIPRFGNPNDAHIELAKKIMTNYTLLKKAGLPSVLDKGKREEIVSRINSSEDELHSQLRAYMIGIHKLEEKKDALNQNYSNYKKEESISGAIENLSKCFIQLIKDNYLQK